ncbi:MAG: hypothetical protein M5U28_32590 [Sandaracinaceae bacterium]|nr:hypothetical protein [Sandaracinaceae bacterium]
MSFFKKLFGGGSFEDERAEADRLFAEGRYEDARLSYQRALERKKGAPADAVERCEERVGECLDRMAEARIAEAEELANDGQIDLAEVELRNAVELAASEEVARRARRALETLEQEDARRQAEGPAEMSDEDRWALLAGAFVGDQADEYEEYGDAFREALLAMHDGEAKEARAALEALAAEHEDACYLWLEIGRARLLDDDFAAAEEGAARVPGSARRGRGRRRAHQRARGARRAARPRGRRGRRHRGAAGHDGRLPGGRAHLLPHGALPAGEGLRRGGGGRARGGRAAARRGPPRRPLPRGARPREDGGRRGRGGGRLPRSRDRLLRADPPARQPQAGLPPATAVARAKLYEKEGALEKAADLYRGLANGSDRANHLTYHREAARLLLELELDEEAQRMLTRALALAEDDAEARAAIEAQLAELE